MSDVPLHPGDNRLILVDNDPSMRKMLEIVLSDQFHVISVQTAEEASERLQKGEVFAIAMASFTLSGMNGLEFLCRVGERHPHMLRVLMTGGCKDMDQVSQAVNDGRIHRLLLKPFSIYELREQIRNDLASVRGVVKAEGSSRKPFQQV